MNWKNAETDSGSYVNGVYTSKNGNTSNGGLNCPRGQGLYDTSVEHPIFFAPEDRQVGEQWEIITPEVAPGVAPYYAISNYGRIENIFTRKVMKPNYRPNGYEYYCLASTNTDEKGKIKQKKFSTHRLVMKTFKPCDNMDNLEVNHIYGDKTKNYVDKIMPDGSIDSSLEWITPRDNIIHAEENGLRGRGKLSMEEAGKIRELHDQGWSYSQIQLKFYPYVSYNTIQSVANNKAYKDDNYVPKKFNDTNPAGVHRLTDKDADMIRKLRSEGYRYEQIIEKFYPGFSTAAISDICRGATHNKT